MILTGFTLALSPDLYDELDGVHGLGRRWRHKADLTFLLRVFSRNKATRSHLCSVTMEKTRETGSDHC